MSETLERRGPRRTIHEFNKPKEKYPDTQEVVMKQHANKPLEMQPVIAAVQEYGRKTHSIGALQGACALQELISEIRALGPQSEELELLLSKGDSSVSELRSYMRKAYK